jgi:hypothetical protein
LPGRRFSLVGACFLRKQAPRDRRPSDSISIEKLVI